MKRRRFPSLMIVLLAMAALFWGVDQSRAARPAKPDNGSRIRLNQKMKVDPRERQTAAARSAAAGLVLPELGAAMMAMPGEAPHYFSVPNYANSPLRLPDALVELVGGGGTGATASATVDALTGTITAIDIINPGSGYTSAPTVVITTAVAIPTAPAAATATVDYSGVVNGITVDLPGSGYTAPSVAITGGGGTGAAATATGGVDAIAVTSGGTGYQQPVVEFTLPEDPNGIPATAAAEIDANGVITAISVVSAGSGYFSAPSVTIRDGADPTMPGPGTGATATATLLVSGFILDNFGSGYTSAPAVGITDTAGIGSGAAATASIATSGGAVTGVTVTDGGAGYMTPGIKKFVDTLPGLGPTGANNLGQYIPVAVADTTTYPGSDYYEIAVVQYQEKMHTNLPPTWLRGYVQLETPVIQGSHYPLGGSYLGVDKPHYLGPLIVAVKDKPVRILFRNLLPTGQGGNLFIPVDVTVMGSGMTPDMGGMMEMDPQHPMCGMDPKPMECFAENRATLHLHGGISPWISDGTPHQWVTPADEMTPYPEGVSVQNVPDMPDPGPGAITFFYTNQQSARLMFYHDHAWGITRLNVYAGEAAAYLITDPTEDSLVAQGILPTDQIPLVIQDKTFVPSVEQLSWQDPTWDLSRWGGPGNLWMPHVYVPAQNPGDASGVNQFGRWAYGPWFWPPTTGIDYPPIDNPYYDPNCNPDVQWCEPPQIPGVPYVSMGMESFQDTPVVNGTAYPTLAVDPKPYRLRILNAANDRFFNLSLYQADASGTEVALNPAEVAAALTDPAGVFPTPVAGTEGPDWIQIGTEGGFLPAPVVIPPQVTTWVTDPTVFNAGNVDQHSLLLGPAERADVIVDFSQFAGQTLILYNDAPAAFPARDPRYDYYTGNPDLTDTGGAPPTLPGYGPNTRTVMQIKVNAGAGSSFNLAALQNAFVATSLGGQGVFENSQNPIIVGQGAYNSAYGTSFPLNGASAGLVQIFNTSFSFKTLLGGAAGPSLTMPLQPKQIQDEMGEAFEQEYGRMSGFLGLEKPGAVAGVQNMILYPYVNPPSEIIDGLELPVGTLDVTPIAAADDGSQIWKITHNGVDTHPIHFHLYDVQLINRVGWDGIIRRPDANELGWKDTVRISPLEDTIVALRPIVPKSPFGLPDSIRPLNPMMPLGSTAMFNSTDANGDPIVPPITNVIHNFGWEYVWHCHILSHEEMDMMRPVSVTVARALPAAPLLSATGNPGSPIDLSWTDGTPVDLLDPASWGDPAAEVGYRIERAAGTGAFEPIGSALANATTFADHGTAADTSYQYRVVAFNAAGDSVSNTVSIGPILVPPLAPSNLAAALLSATQVGLTWTDNAANEAGFQIERATVTNGVIGPFAPHGTVDVDVTSYTDPTVAPSTTYAYQVYAFNADGNSPMSNVAQITTPAAQPPLATPTNLVATMLANPLRVRLVFRDNALNEDGFTVERSDNGGAFAPIATLPPRANRGNVTYIDTTVVPGSIYGYRVQAFNNAGGVSPYSNTATISATAPAAPSNFFASAVISGTNAIVTLSWTDNSNNELRFRIQRATNATFTQNLATYTVGANVTTRQETRARNRNYYYRIQAYNAAGASAWVNALPFPIHTP
ncbi:MAG: multicopper oxidase domain-containing protein [bacterium]